jgi:hypothetical protein
MKESRWSDSNRRPALYENAALPLSYIGLSLLEDLVSFLDTANYKSKPLLMSSTFWSIELS